MKGSVPSTHSGLNSRPCDDAIGRIARILLEGGGGVLERIDDALEDLRAAVGADEVEMFLAEPDGGDLLMVSCLGEEVHAFRQRTRFVRGCGFPGLVFDSGRPLSTDRLDVDTRFLRSDVVRHGFHAFASLPLVGGDNRPVGTLNLAWRQRPRSNSRIDRILPTCCRLIAMAITSDLHTLEGKVDAWSRQTKDEENAQILRRLLMSVQAEAGARSGQMILLDETGKKPRIITLAETGFGQGATATCVPSRCAFVAAGHGALVPSSDGAGQPGCSRQIDGEPCACCLPLVSDGTFRGVIQLGFEAAEPELPGRRLPLLLHLARGVARFAAHANDSGPESRSVQVRDPDPHRAEDDRRLVVCCFGGLRIHSGDRTIDTVRFSRKHAVDLLRMLALRAGTVVPRHVLAERLWPESAEGTTDNRFFVTVHSLRSDLQQLSGDRTLGTLIRCEAGGYALGPADEVWVDVIAFRHRTRLARRCVREGREAEAAMHFRNAAALYTGDLFEDSPYQDWCAIDRVELQRAFLDALEYLATWSLQEGEREQAIVYLRRALAWEPLREDLRRQLVETLFEIGRRSEALAQYRECVWLVRSELAMEPLPETLKLEALFRSDAQSD